ncbi:hypothetical protein Tola_1611 [Tolumonas auensis DSM 9187]|uniref:Competence CoiA family protein n=1 Tax=Tolumonas auensis (strain DSM 9187 / NBRC 110442 / TA 4) TaxID=595494 RepID=C4LF55_TOLAT|nr:hypothetical protein [Tolumonas auensis]ACQ93222.1 hypothetical protein Tola_1611 [Tolumonas auensis DSM 9187]
MAESLIPFAFHVATGRLVEVDEVPRGLKCGCICPGCQTPLVGRECIDRIDHFAHKTRNSYEETKTECNYSFVVSIRAMCKQLLSELKRDFVIPEYHLTSEPQTWPSPVSPANGKQELLSIPAYTITIPAKVISLSPQDIRVECNFNGVVVDGLTQNRNLVIYFVYEGRPIPELLLVSNTADVVVIDLVAMEPVLRTKDKLHSIRSRLSDFIYDDVRFKQLVSFESSSVHIADLEKLVNETKHLTENEWLKKQDEDARLAAYLAQEALNTEVRDQQRWEEARLKEAQRRQFSESNRRFRADTPAFDNAHAHKKLSMEEIINYITMNGAKPSDLQSLVILDVIEVGINWIIVEKDRIWYVTSGDWRTANMRYAAGMRTGIWVERTEELDYSLGLRKPRANVEW